MVCKENINEEIRKLEEREADLYNEITDVKLKLQTLYVIKNKAEN